MADSGGKFVRVARRERRYGPPADDKPLPDGAGPDKRLSSPRPGPNEHERIVVPRQTRGESRSPGVDVELREVRYGAASRGPYLRVTPRLRKFTSLSPGHIEATRAASVAASPLGRLFARVKIVAIGDPLATSKLDHQRLSKVQGLGVFSSDPLSSAAYSAEEIMLVLILAGAAALYLTVPITIALLALLWVVRLSYLQTIRAYPNGGGAYIVAHENLGWLPGLVAAAALMVDYTLTVSVSVAAGTAAITSALPEALDYRLAIALIAVALVTWGNLRGIRDSGFIFGLPTYLFVFAFGGMIVVGVVRVALGDAPGSFLSAAEPVTEQPVLEGVTLFLVLRAFSSGASALTGVEAISNGVPAFKKPAAHNARVTMQWEAALLGFLLLGVAFLATRYGLAPSHDETLVSQLGRDVLGKNVLYYVYQVATAAVLFLAANTAYADFPRMAAILGRDRYAPRQLSFMGDRLAFSNGIILLAAAASVLLVVFDAQVTKLIPLYVLGVFISMTLSQFGMVQHWLRLKESGWRGSIAMNFFGGSLTAVVCVIVGSSKFTHGAWISLLAMAALVVIFALINRHYRWFASRVSVDEGAAPAPITARPLDSGGRNEHVVVPVDEVNKITLAAVGLAREISPLITAVHLTDDRDAAERFRERWERAVPDVPLLVIESPYRAFAAPMVAFLQRLRDSDPRKTVRVILPAFAVRHWWERFLHNRDVQRLERALEDEPGVETLAFSYEL